MGKVLDYHYRKLDRTGNSIAIQNQLYGMYQEIDWMQARCTMYGVPCAACIPDAALFESHVFFFASTYQPAGIGLVTVLVPVEINKLIHPAALNVFCFAFCYM